MILPTQTFVFRKIHLISIVSISLKEATITRWVRKYKDEGTRGLLEVKQAPGNIPLISGSDLESLKKRL
ncbi:MAG: hypothetical protein ACYTXA_14225 [Nostoc sp.]